MELGDYVYRPVLPCKSRHHRLVRQSKSGLLFHTRNPAPAMAFMLGHGTGMCAPHGLHRRGAAHQWVTHDAYALPTVLIGLVDHTFLDQVATSGR